MCTVMLAVTNKKVFLKETQKYLELNNSLKFPKPTKFLKTAESKPVKS